MDRLINFHSYPVKDVLKILLADKTTKQNIIWATDTYSFLGQGYSDKDKITPAQLTGANADTIQPRVFKDLEEQALRTKKKAEVFTPSWICNKMINFCDEEWFGQKDVFNVEAETTWMPTTGKIVFPEKKKWIDYIDTKYLEITCGEAPFITSRYDAATGEELDEPVRMGVLDRKLRVVNENAQSDEEWEKWVVRAYQSVYGYEYQGDNLLFARINLLLTFDDCYRAKFQKKPAEKLLRTIANTISWNFWQMDGLKGTVPFGKLYEAYYQMSMFDPPIEEAEPQPVTECKIYDWRRDNSFFYNQLKGNDKMKKFDFVIGNPPYQVEVENNERMSPVYHLFMEEAYKIADVVEMITPARFLYNAGQTPKKWNKKRLNDPHFKVLFYEVDSSKVFSNTDIKGGVAITFRDRRKDYGKIDTFTAFEELNDILKKVTTISGNKKPLSEIVVGAVPYRFSDKLREESPELTDEIGASYDLRTNVLVKFNDILFFNEKPKDKYEYVQIIGLEKAKRVIKWIKRIYIKEAENFEKYKVLLPESNGSGALGEVLSTPLIGQPLIGHTQTFISIGNYETLKEAENLLKYIKTKFCRVLLGSLKITQHNSKATWRNVPLQDFTENSDIDWSVSVAEVDKQLYQKYGLDAKEIDFIETKVKEMD